jgi:hypothetical protein
VRALLATDDPYAACWGFVPLWECDDDLVDDVE